MYIFPEQFLSANNFCSLSISPIILLRARSSIYFTRSKSHFFNRNQRQPIDQSAWSKNRTTIFLEIGTAQHKGQKDSPPKDVSSLTHLSEQRIRYNNIYFPGGGMSGRSFANEEERNEMERIWGNNNYHATTLTTTTTTMRWWPVVNETTEWKINKIKGKKIGWPSNEGNGSSVSNA